jgi:transcriptional regulator of acetoin/glycerol metabolism
MRRTERLVPEDERETGAPPARSWLVRVGGASEPHVPPAIHLLDEREKLSLGRAHQPELRDPWLSADHAELRFGDRGWEVHDLGSSNGTLHLGERKARAALADGDLIETGGTFWLFRTMRIEPDELPKPPFSGPLATLHPEFNKEIDRLKRVGRTRVPMMLVGSTGTGKEVLAKEVHALSRRSGRFVAINTAAIQKTLVASELFGVEKGAHSAAEKARPGQIRAAEKGTLLLDEIGDMPAEVQVALLRVLQESELVPVGGDVPVKVDVRVLCATHHDLDLLVEAGSFRADLLGRLSGCKISLPDLADRVEDVGLLISAILTRLGATTIELSPAAYRALLTYGWPRNVRELEKTLESAVAICDRDRIELKHLPEDLQKRPPVETPELAQQSRRDLERLLELHKGNVSKVAKALGLSRGYVHRWLKRLGITPESFR